MRGHRFIIDVYTAVKTRGLTRNKATRRHVQSAIISHQATSWRAQQLLARAGSTALRASELASCSRCRRSSSRHVPKRMNALASARMAQKQQAGVNIHLYSDDHPETTTRGTGFKDAAAAHRTLALIATKPRNRQVWTVNAMLNRAKHHPSQTVGMRGAMEIFQRWMNEYRAEKGSGLADAHSKGQSRQRLEKEYKQLFNVELPATAKAGRWPVYMNHCLMRVALDGYWQCCWYEKLDQKRGALASMTVPQIENVIAIGQRMLEEGRPYVTELNLRSLAYRGKLKRKQATPSEGSEQLGQSAVKVARMDPPSPAAIPSDGPSVVAAPPPDAGKLLQVEQAKSGRATCKGCAEMIPKGQWRIGLPAWVGGRKVITWQHPRCALQHSVAFERAPNGLARCKATAHRFAKGELRGRLTVNGSKSFYQLEALCGLLRPVRKLPECSEWRPHDATGFADLDECARAAVEEATGWTEPS